MYIWDYFDDVNHNQLFVFCLLLLWLYFQYLPSDWLERLL